MRFSHVSNRLEIEAYARELQAQRKALHEDDEDESRIAFSATSGGMDSEIYGSTKDKFAGYVTSIGAKEDENDVSFPFNLLSSKSKLVSTSQDDDYAIGSKNGAVADKRNVHAPAHFLNENIDEVRVLSTLCKTNVNHMSFRHRTTTQWQTVVFQESQIAKTSTERELASKSCRPNE